MYDSKSWKEYCEASLDLSDQDDVNDAFNIPVTMKNKPAHRQQ